MATTMSLTTALSRCRHRLTLMQLSRWKQQQSVAFGGPTTTRTRTIANNTTQSLSSLSILPYQPKQEHQVRWLSSSNSTNEMKASSGSSSSSSSSSRNNDNLEASSSSNARSATKSTTEKSTTSTTTKAMTAKMKMERLPPSMEGKPLPFIDAVKLLAWQQAGTADENGNCSESDETSVLPCLGIWTLRRGDTEFMVGIPADTAVCLVYDEPGVGMRPLHMDDDRMKELFPVAKDIVQKAFAKENEETQNNNNNEKEVTGVFGEEVELKWTPETLTMTGRYAGADGEEEEEFPYPTDKEIEQEMEAHMKQDKQERQQQQQQSPSGFTHSYMGDKNASPLETLDMKIQVIVTFTHKNETFHVAKWLEPMFLISRLDLTNKNIKTAPRILLTEEESAQVMPLLEHADMDSVDPDELDRMEAELIREREEMQKSRQFSTSGSSGGGGGM